jgi:signal transduction histidine kinase
VRRVTALLDRVPVRVRVTLAFTAVMAVLLAGAGGFLYLRLGATLRATVDDGLQSRAGDLAALIGHSPSALAEAGRSPLTEQRESLAQIIDTSGKVVDATTEVGTAALLTPGQIDVAARRTLVTQVVLGGDENDVLRVLATPVRADAQRLVVVVASSLEPTREAQHTLGRQLIVGGPILLLIAALVGYGAAAGALRPVESMRRRAALIDAGAGAQRLPVPPSGDEVARLGQTLNEMLARLEDAFARERTFVSDASHELRTPLTILKGELDLAMANATTVEDFRTAVATAAEETDRVVQLAEDLLVLARSDQGRLPLRVTDVSAAELLESTTQRFARRSREHGVQLAVHADQGLVLHADPLRLEQALGNLIDNALRHGGLRVTVSATREGEQHDVLCVADDGPGFPPEFLPSVFERFTRASVARGRGGSGLGLAIVRAIAEAHDGTVSARNAEDGGAEVRIVISARPGSADRGGEPRKSGGRAEPAPNSRAGARR